MLPLDIGSIITCAALVKKKNVANIIFELFYATFL